MAYSYSISDSIDGIILLNVYQSIIADWKCICKWIAHCKEEADSKAGLRCITYHCRRSQNSIIFQQLQSSTNSCTPFTNIFIRVF